jgi:hypothetical protein
MSAVGEYRLAPSALCMCDRIVIKLYHAICDINAENYVMPVEIWDSTDLFSANEKFVFFKIL